MSKIELNSLTLEELKEFMYSIGEEKYRGEQLFNYIHSNKGCDISEITVFSKKMQDKLQDIGKINNLEIFKRFDSKLDNTKKYLFLLEDNNIIEGVVMEYEHGWTACISTQVGCKMGCVFCASTKNGLIRNLLPSEMVNQIYTMEKDLNIRINNIVLMGSGEPLDNYENVLKFLRIIHDEKGHNTSYRNITLSTCGIVPKIYELAEEKIPITLSISLHSPFDEIRRKMMPISNKYFIDDILEACRYYSNKTNRRITIEYTLIEGVNDRIKDILQLTNILSNLNCHINLIPLNPIKEFDKNRSSNSSIMQFKDELMKTNIPVTIRREMGKDIDGACGQLRRRYITKDTN
ncbi:23S rRNA m(2)A-2503 methyltransferase [Keratinibaculum paraultunense]|uniref:Probable dual-specificity RNA methyltransferase RlmN n=1 Tax=Keratinibaculum paraultunense TaxID=1278232 RepID=A0A4R3KWC2_9FIRM|nr:23S rRNA (adenine(2503)-C(2))-methyltransferase RlmN [Keratinibaculum paraultunense]QQY80785.1 23S rRNA (adenine(2503)-C(2))-methyltransferase RlmN [Keratinibaculum paraultunense]TCS89603.1 23S rRNA m(2)A-2503 methyltransferase [Keratinibaculum paraultunense]